MSEKDTLWNRFIEEICDRDAETLSPIQKKAVLCFWYDAEMQNGGHSGYLDCYPETNNAYYDFEPSLCDCLEEFIWVNRNVIFD